MGRYNFSAEELARRAALSSELKKKFLARRAVAAAAAGPEKGPKKEESKKLAPVAVTVDRAALRAQAQERRNFLLGTAAFTGAIALTLGGVQRFMFPRILFEPPSVFDAGRPDAYLPNQPVFIKEYRTWLINSGDRIIALSGRCTHLGCTPAWLAADSKFKCPCHGSGFRMSGVNFEGPAPRALERFKITLAGSTITVDKGKMFLYEKGDWENPESFLVV